MGITVVAALVVSGAPTLAGRQIDSIPVAFSPLDVDTAAYRRPVEVSLLSGVDAIAWEMENITSAAEGVQVADASRPGAAIGSGVAGGQFTGRLVGQNVGPLGVLPGGIQLIHPVASLHITSPYGWRNNPTGPGTQIHIGQDYGLPCGSPVYATADGVVVQSAWAGHSGMRVTIDHGSSVRTGYSHNSRLIARVGDTVRQGQVIALSGTTGNSTGCHVHFEVIINGRWNDPRNFLPRIPGQPNPKIDSRRTTIAAEPIRNSGEPRTESRNGHDIEVELPKPPKATPKPTPPGSETSRPEASEEATPEKTTPPAPTKSPTPTPKPSVTPSPTAPSPTSPTPTAPSPTSPSPTSPSPTSPTPTAPSPTKTPAPETSSTQEPSEEPTPPPSSSQTVATPTVSPSVEPTNSPPNSPSSSSAGTQSTMPTKSSASASTESASYLSDSSSGTLATESSSDAATSDDGTGETLSSSATTAESR